MEHLFPDSLGTSIPEMLGKKTDIEQCHRVAHTGPAVMTKEEFSSLNMEHSCHIRVYCLKHLEYFFPAVPLQITYLVSNSSTSPLY